MIAELSASPKPAASAVSNSVRCSVERGEIRVDHPRALRVHCPGICSAGFQNLQRQFGIHSTTRRKRQALGKCGTVQSQDEVHDQLRPRTLSARANVEDLVSKTREKIPAVVENLRIASDHRYRLPVSHLGARSTHGGIKVMDASLMQPLCQRRHAFRISGGRIDDDCSESQLRFHLGDYFRGDAGIRQGQHDSAARLRYQRRRRLHAAAKPAETVASCRIDIEAHHAKARAEKALRERRAQLRGGRYVDRLHFGLLRSEFRGRQAAERRPAGAGEQVNR